MAEFPDIPGYRLEERIGEGGMAVVYRAVQIAFDRPVALKILTPQLARDKDFGRRFLREARIVGQLSHANIVPVYDVGQKDGNYYLSMEWLTGGDLGSHLAQGLSSEEALQILAQMARALRYAHKQGFIHRDIKPDNILFRDSETAVLTDFGIARNLGDQTQVTEITTVQSVIGSPRYMSPEQTRGEELDQRSDIYSLGVVAFQMLTGQVPHDGRSLTEIALNRHDNQRPLLPGHLSHLQPLIDGLLAYDPAKRYADCEALLNQLKALSQNPRVEASTPAAVAMDDNRTEVLSVTRLDMSAPEPVSTASKGPQPSERNTGETGSHPVTSQSSNWLYVLPLVLLVLGLIVWWGFAPEKAREPAPAQTLSDNPAAQTIEESLTPQPVPLEAEASEPETPEPNQITPPSAETYFAFRDAILENSPAAGERFLARVSDSVLSDIVRVHLLQQPQRVAELLAKAEQGDSQAQLVVSELSATGWGGVAQDPSEARKWALAALRGSDSAFAQYHLGALYLTAARAGNTVNREYLEEAVPLLQTSAEQGFFLAETLLGTLYFEGLGVPRDTARSIALFERAASQGDRNALFNLGQMYDAGLGVEKPDPARARSYFQRSADLGHRDALDYLR